MLVLTGSELLYSIPKTINTDFVGTSKCLVIISRGGQRYVAKQHDVSYDDSNKVPMQPVPLPLSSTFLKEGKKSCLGTGCDNSCCARDCEPGSFPETLQASGVVTEIRRLFLRPTGVSWKDLPALTQIARSHSTVRI